MVSVPIDELEEVAEEIRKDAKGHGFAGEIEAEQAYDNSARRVERLIEKYS